MTKQSYKVTGHAAKVGDRDIEVIVKAKGVEDAKAEALKKEPTLSKHADLRIYKQGGWTRVA